MASEPASASTEELPIAAPTQPRAKDPDAGKPELLNLRMLLLAALLGSVALMAYPPLNEWAAAVSDRLMASGRKQAATDESAWKAGATALVDITVVTADVWRLACASDQVIEGRHCGFKADKSKWPDDPSKPVDDNRVDIIQPYRTENGNLLLTVSGLWAQPEIAARVHQEPPRIVATKRQKRFTARCTVKFIGTLTDSKLQWNQGNQWFDQKSVMVAQAEECHVKTTE
jgi:hypothetical protein